jgi:hypothetical protein
VLLEVIVALTILAFGCLAVMSATDQIGSTAFQVAATEAATGRADQYLTAISLWPREELDRHLGAHRRGEWVLEIERPDPVLYEVRLSDSTAQREILSTTLYRAAPLAPERAP